MKIHTKPHDECNIDSKQNVMQLVDSLTFTPNRHLKDLNWEDDENKEDESAEYDSIIKLSQRFFFFAYRVPACDQSPLQIAT